MIEAKRVVGVYWSTEVKPVPGGGHEYESVTHGYLDPRSVANELLNDGYEADGLITLMTLRPWELSTEGEAELAKALRELGVRPLTLREATLILAREEARRAFAGDLWAWNLLSRLKALDRRTDEAAPELEKFRMFWPDDPDWWGDRPERGERMILDMARALLADVPGRDTPAKEDRSSTNSRTSHATGEGEMSKPLRCWFGWHRWKRQVTDDGKAFLRCSRCQKYRDIPDTAGYV